MDDYEIIEEIAEGAYGSVSKALDRRGDSYCAIKKLLKRYEHPDDCRREVEVQLMSKI